MTLRVDYGPQARTDLLDIYHYIHADNPPAARRVVEKINTTCEATLADNPFIGRPRDALQPDLRSFPVRPYIIFYRTTEHTIDIIRVLHGARDIDAIFNP